MSSPLVSPQARMDLREITWQIARDRPNSATRMRNSLWEAFELLAANPKIGRARAEIRADLRSFPIPPYIVFYRPVESTVEILRVVHGARDIDEAFFSG